MHLTSHITHSNGYAPYIAYYRSNGVDQLFRKLKPKPKLNPPNAHRSQIKICENRQTQNVQFPFMPNAFRILKPIQKSSKRVWVFRNTGANAFAKNQMRLAYEDKRDLYCNRILEIIIKYHATRKLWPVSRCIHVCHMPIASVVQNRYALQRHCLWRQVTRFSLITDTWIVQVITSHYLSSGIFVFVKSFRLTQQHDI